MNDLREKYKDRYNNVLVSVAIQLEELIKEYFVDFERIDRIVTRAKSVESFCKKANKKNGEKPQYTDPLNQIQDQVGARIVTFYKDDVNRVSDLILNYFRPIESKDLFPESEWEFGYFGRHYILLLPSDISITISSEILPFFELQIKTLFQHSWSEANHDLGYKPSETIGADFKRKIAFASAQAWGADEIFNELFRNSRQMKE